MPCGYTVHFYIFIDKNVIHYHNHSSFTSRRAVQQVPQLHHLLCRIRTRSCFTSFCIRLSIVKLHTVIPVLTVWDYNLIIIHEGLWNFVKIWSEFYLSSRAVCVPLPVLFIKCFPLFWFQDTQDELEILSIVPRKPLARSADLKQCVYRVTPLTKVTFLARHYRFAFILDLSPSIATVVRGTSVTFQQWILILLSIIIPTHRKFLVSLN